MFTINLESRQNCLKLVFKLCFSCLRKSLLKCQCDCREGSYGISGESALQKFT